MDENILARKIAAQVGHAWVETTTRQDNMPFYRGDLRKSVITQGSQVRVSGQAVLVTVGSNLGYARAVHDGRRALVIRPKKAKVLTWWTNKEKARQLVPFPQDRVAFRAAVQAGEIRVAKRVFQKARQPNPFFIRGVETLQREKLKFLEGLFKRATVQELEETVKYFKAQQQ